MAGTADSSIGACGGMKIRSSSIIRYTSALAEIDEGAELHLM